MSAPLRLTVVHCAPYRERITNADCAARQLRAVDPTTEEPVRRRLVKCLTCERNANRPAPAPTTSVAGVKVDTAALDAPLDAPLASRSVAASLDDDAGTRPAPGRCRLGFCGRTAETSDRLCGYHDAMERGEAALDAWRRMKGWMA